VVEAAQRLGYFPHASARAMACKEVSNLGLLVGTEPTRSVMAHILPGVQREMLKRNLHLTVAELPDAPCWRHDPQH
jgi:DNA-binding LacI/PurR family transcriptional regulator